MDNDIAIRTEGLGKRYRLGQTVDLSRTFREVIMGLPQMFHHHARKALMSPASDPEHPDTRGGYFWALRDIDLEIKHGETLGIIGRNGAGKSTLLKVLSRITAPTVGTADIYGRIGSLLEVGTGFHPELTGRENIYLNGAILGMRKTEIDARFDEIVQFAQTEQFLDTPVKRYSSGMRVRLAFAVAAHLDTEILIVDEVLSVGDAEFRKRCLGKMSDVTKQGRTVLFVSHNMAAIQNLCDSCLVIEKGKADFIGPTDDAVEYYLQKGTEEKHEEPALLAAARKPDATPVITDVRLLDTNGNPTRQYMVGAPIMIEIDYEHTENLKRPIFGIVIENALGQRLAFLQTRIQLGDIAELPDRETVRCSVKDLHLIPDTYYLTIGCTLAGMQVDKLERCLSFSLESADVYGTGQLPKLKQGHLLLDYQWIMPPKASVQETETP